MGSLGILCSQLPMCGLHFAEEASCRRRVAGPHDHRIARVIIACGSPPGGEMIGQFRLEANVSRD